MRERILEFIESEKISAAEFADKIGVQRSSISHVLNGRNNPGFAFIQKILEAYPSINSRWLITGTGQMHDNKPEKKSIESNIGNLFSTSSKMEQGKPLSQTPLNEIVQPTEKLENSVETPISQPAHNIEKVVTRVLIFYSDHTFEDFRPAK